MQITYSLDTGIEGHKVPVIEAGEKSVHLGSIYDGGYASSQWIQCHVPEETEYIVLFGMGDGKLLLELKEKVPGYLMVYEPDIHIFRMMEQTATYKKIQMESRIMITCGESQFSEFEELVRELLNEDCVDTTCLLFHPGYRNFYQKECERVEALCHTVCDEIDFMKGALKRFIKAMVQNQLRNLPYMKNGVLLAKMKKYWNPEVPVLIVSAGPSLEKNMQELKRVHDRAVVFCADAALPLLLQHDIFPNLVGCTDAKKNMNCFSEPKSMELPLLVTTNSPVPLIHNSTGTKIWGDDLAYVREILIHSDVEIPKIPSYLGVSTTLFATALELGARQIILVGQDLAYSQDGRSHTTGRNEGFVKDDRFRTEGYYGDVVWSRGDWTVFREWFEDAIRAFPNCIVTNATEGGAKIHGAIQKPLSEAVEALPKREIKWQELLDNKNTRLSAKEFQRIMREHHKSAENLKSIRKMGYSRTFFDTNYMRIPVMRMVIDMMKSLENGNRKERFERAVNDLIYVFEKEKIK